MCVCVGIHTARMLRTLSVSAPEHFDVLNPSMPSKSGLSMYHIGALLLPSPIRPFNRRKKLLRLGKLNSGSLWTRQFLRPYADEVCLEWAGC